MLVIARYRSNGGRRSFSSSQLSSMRSERRSVAFPGAAAVARGRSRYLVPEGGIKTGDNQTTIRSARVFIALRSQIAMQWSKGHSQIAYATAKIAFQMAPSRARRGPLRKTSRQWRQHRPSPRSSERERHPRLLARRHMNYIR